MGRLAGKIAIVTGAAPGQGAAHARRFIVEGASVVLGDVDEAGGTALAAELGRAARFVRLDVADEESWRAALELACAELGPPAVLVNTRASSSSRACSSSHVRHSSVCST